MRTIFQVLKQFLNAGTYKWERKGDRVRFPVHGENGTWLAMIGWNEDDRWVLVRSVIGFNVPPAKRRSVAEFIARANYGRFLGNFEMDFADGEVGFRTSLAVPEDPLSPTMLTDLVYVNFAATDRYLPGLMAVVYGGRCVRKVIEQVEGTETEPLEEAGVESNAPPATRPPADEP